MQYIKGTGLTFLSRKQASGKKGSDILSFVSCPLLQLQSDFTIAGHYVIMKMNGIKS
jgi:hypothetical protein